MKRAMTRKGLTLLELVVVLVILVALAGILVPLLPGMIGRAHTAEHGTNVGEVAKAIQAYEILQRTYPDNLDSLGDGISLLPGGTTTTACGGELTSVALSTIGTDSGADALAGLQAAGINTVWTPTGTELITEPYGSAATGTALAAASKVAVLSDAAMKRLYNEKDTTEGTTTTPSPAKYVVFGLGPKCDIVGKPGGVAEAPVHFSDESGNAGNPNLTYARFGLVFRVVNSSNTTLSRAQFAGVVAFHEGSGDEHGVTNASDAIAEYHEQNAQ
jgi:prepilin-type N-terminal cleavage/methylation domain-containing protein